jgi:glycosyltransferase involved in cell wall biosynthesis
MRVVVYEPDPEGHRFAYLAHVMPALALLPCEPILLTTPAAAKAPEFALHLGPHAHRFAVDNSTTILAKPRTLGRLRQQWADLVRAVRRVQPAHLYVAYGDGLVQIAGLERLLVRRPWSDATEAEVLLLRGGYTYGAANVQKRLRAALSPALIRRGPWNRIHHINPDDVAVLSRGESEAAGRYRLMPDPVEPPSAASKTEARRALGIPDTGRYIGCAGMINKPKGIDLLLAAYQLAQRDLHENDRLLLAGRVAPEIRTILEHQFADDMQRGRVVLVERHLRGTEMNLAVAAMDVVCTPYPTHIHSASIVIRAAAAGRPVLGSAMGWMERTINRFQLGNVCDVSDSQAFAQAIIASLDAAERFAPTEASGRFAAFHSAENFTAHLTARLRERLGLPPVERVEWEWVMAAKDARC